MPYRDETLVEFYLHAPHTKILLGSYWQGELLDSIKELGYSVLDAVVKAEV
jgi:hypothetical protein